MIKERTAGQVFNTFIPEYCSFWHVERDFNAPPFTPALRGATEPENLYGIFRTYRGTGKMVTKNKTYYLTAGSLVILKIDTILTYNPPKDNDWEYVCVNYTSPNNIPYFNHNVVYEVPFLNDEKEVIQEIFKVSKQTETIYKQLCYLKITELIMNWAKVHQEKQIQVLPYAEEINHCIVYINENLSAPLKTSDLAKKYGLSESTFYRAFTAITGISPKHYIVQQRLTNAAFLLKITARTIQSISYEVGYYSEFQFSRDFKKRYGIPPSLFRTASYTRSNKNDDLMK